MNSYPQTSRALLPFAPGLLLLLSLLGLATGCATRYLLLGTVGPDRFSPSSLSSHGLLVVYTHLESPTASMDEFAKPQRSAYRLFSTNGNLFKYVGNRDSVFDDRPETVSLPAALYTVRSSGPDYHPVSVPVLIVAGKMTTVHLDGSEPAHRSQGAEPDFVTLPNGTIVGWRAENPFLTNR